MATRSLIGIKTSSGEVDYIYCHWDGYPSHNGRILMENYTSPPQVMQLLELGDISSLGKEIGEKQDFNNVTNPDWCLSYHRDRGDDLVDDRYAESEDEFRNIGYGSQYKYLFKNRKWYFSYGERTFVELTAEICNG